MKNNPVPSRLPIKPSILATSAAALLAIFWPAQAKAQTWLASPVSGDWNTPANWSGGTVPNNAAADVVFGTSNTNTVTLASSGVAVASITFNGTTAYTLNLDQLMVIHGTGMANSSGLQQNINITSLVNWKNSSTAGGNNIVYAVQNGGTAQFGDSSTLGAAIVNIASGGTLQMLDSSTGGTARVINNGNLFLQKADGVLTIGSLEGNGIVAFSNLGGGATAQNLSVGSLNTSTTFSGVIKDGTGATGALTKVGTGTFTLTGANTYTGGTTISAGTLQLGEGGSIVGDILNNATLNVNQTGTLTLSGTITGNGQVTKDGTGTLTLTGTNNYSGGTVLNAGTLIAGNGAALGGGTLTINGGTLAAQTNPLHLNIAVVVNGDFSTTRVGPASVLSFDNTVDLGGGSRTITNVNGGNTAFSGVISNGTGLTLASTVGTPSLFQFTSVGVVDNTYTGTTTLNGPTTLLLTRAAGSNAIPGDLVINDGSAVHVQMDEQIVDTSNVTLNGTGIFQLIGASETIASINSTSTTSNVDVNTGTLTLKSATDAVFAGTITGDANGVLNKDGTNTVALTGVNTYQGGTTITAGTLQIGDGGTTGSIVGDVTDNATLAFNRTDNYTFAGDISGSGAVIQRGGGALILTGTSSYNGTTTVQSGTLLVNGILGNTATTVGSGATLGGSGTIGGAVLVQNGGFLAPGASPTGVSTATLHVNSLKLDGGSQMNFELGTASDKIVVANGFTSGTVGSYGINIADAGGITNQTHYDLIDFGSTNFAASDFTFSTTVSGLSGFFTVTGTELDFDISGIIANGPIIQNSAPIMTPKIADFMVGGAVTTGGPTEDNTIQTLTFLQGGSLLIHHTLYVTQGPVILVNGSSITLDGSLSASRLQMLAGSALHGNGSIIGDLINGGLVSPGNSPGQIHVTGNYQQTPTGTLRIEIGGRDLAQHDLLSVGGKANLDGTLQLVRLDQFKLKRDQAVTFLTANGGVEGRFGAIENAFTSDTILQSTVVYHADSVALEAVQGSFAKYADGAGLTRNQKAVASALDSVAFRTNPAKVIDYLDNRPLSKLPGDFDKIAPEELTSMFTIATSLATAQSQNIQRRNDDIRSGSSGFTAAGLAVNGSGPSYSGGFGISTGVAGPTGDSKESAPVAVYKEDPRWGAFLSGTGEWVSVGDTDNARGYDLTSGGFTLGVDYKVTPNLAVGLAAGYTGSSADLTDRGRVYVNGGKVGLYATFFQNAEITPAPTMSKDSSKDLSKDQPAPITIAKGFYADVAVFGGYNSYDTRRSALQGEARGDTDGGELNALVGIGYDFKKGGLTFGPTATFNYTYLGTDEYTEHGSLAPLDIHGGHGESLRSAFGFKASYDWKVGSVLIKPEIRAAWQHEFGDAAYALDSNLAGDGGSSFLVNGPQLGRDSVLLGGGVAVQFSDRCSTYLYYDGELGRTNYQSTSVTGGFRVAF